MKRLGGLTLGVALTLAVFSYTPASAAGAFGHSTELLDVAGAPVVDVAARRRVVRRGRGNNGAAAAALIGAAIVGGAIIANSQSRRRTRYVDDGYYYGEPQPQYYYGQSGYVQQPYYGGPGVVYQGPQQRQRYNNNRVDRPGVVYTSPRNRERHQYDGATGQVIYGGQRGVDLRTRNPNPDIR